MTARPTSIAPLATDLFRLMELEPLRLPDRVASYPVSVNLNCLTEQERKWLAEDAEAEQAERNDNGSNK